MKTALVQISESFADSRMAFARDFVSKMNVHVDFIFLSEDAGVHSDDEGLELPVAPPQPMVDVEALPVKTNFTEVFAKHMAPQIESLANPDHRQSQLIISDSVATKAFIECGLFHDLLIVDRSLSTDLLLGLLQQDVKDVAKQSQKLVLALPESTASTKLEGDVLIIWNDPVSTARAIIDAVPLLAKANSVSLYIPSEYDKALHDEASSPIIQAVAFLGDQGIYPKLIRDSDMAANGSSLEIELNMYSYVLTGIDNQTLSTRWFSSRRLNDIINETPMPLLLAA